MSSSDNPTLNEMEVSEPTEKSSTDNSSRLVKAREKPVDKRKAPEKDDSFSDTDLSSQKTPMKKLKMSTSAIGYEEMNMDETQLLKDDDSKQLESLSESAEASLLRTTTVEGDDNSQIKGKDEGNESGDSNNSDKFYSQIQIKEMEEKEKSLSISPLLEDPGLATISSISDGLDNKNAAVASWAENNNKYARKGSSSLSFESLVLPSTKPVHVYMKILDPTTNRLIYETKGDWIMSQFGTVKTFLSDHQVEVSSKLSGSGYSADISSQNLSSGSDVFSRPRQVSLGSTIPRPSDASTVNRPSINPADDDSLTRKGRGRGRGGRQYKPNAPAFSSTMIIPNVASTSTSNGEDHSNGIKAIVNMETSTSSEEQTTVRKPRGKSTPRPVFTPVVKTEQKGGASNRSTTDTSTSTTTSSSQSDSDVKIKSEPGEEREERERKRVKVARGKGLANSKSVDEFDDPKFIKSSTLWTTIGQGEVVFARWRDKSYYSGQIIKKGMNDTWQIHFEDDIEDVASETHILPIKILGVGTWTVYCPPNEYKPEDVLIVGQRFLDNKDDLERIEYAVKSNNDGRIIVCARKNLTLIENDARDMRKTYQVQEITKAADLSLDNIVAGPRRRVGGTSPTPSDMLRKLVAGAFDASSTDESAALREASTPTPKGSKTPSGRGRRGSGSTTASEDTDDKSSDMQQKTPGGSSHVSGDKSKTPSTFAAKDTPKSGTKRSKKLFHGMQFFLTAASGGTDPPAGKAGPVAPYEKDELRDLITKNGGLVVDQVGRENHKGKNVFLISDNFARTVKYIYALAAGTPCVSYKWIQACVDAENMVDYKEFELDSGQSLETGATIPAHNRKPLRGVKVYVTAESEELFNYWKPVLLAAEANLLKPVKGKGKKAVLIPPETEILVTDITCDNDVLEFAEKAGIPFVKPEWLVQTIITGKKVDFAGHIKYSVTEEEPGEEDNDNN